MTHPHRIRDRFAPVAVLASFACLAATVAVPAATAASAVAAAAKPPSTAKSPTALPPVGNDGQGVSIVNRGGIAFSFSAAAASRYQAIAGRRVAITCGKAMPEAGGLLTTTVPHAIIVTAPRTAGVVASGYRSAADWCSLGLVLGKKEKVVAVAATTRLGSQYLNQSNDIRVILTIYFLPGSFIAGNEQTILTNIGGVALPTENSPIPAGKFGLYYRPNHIFIGCVDALGTRLFVRQDTTTITSNLLGFFHASVGVYVGQTVKIP